MLLGTLGVTGAMADIAAFTPSGPVLYAGQPGDPVNLGIEFTVDSTISVDALGFYYLPPISGSPGTPSSELVGLYNSNGNLIVDINVAPTNPVVDGYVFQGLSVPVSLIAGAYTVVANTGDNDWGYISPNAPSSVNSAPQIAFGHSDYLYTGSLAYPSSEFVLTYFGPNFEIGTGSAVTPEPGSYAALILGFGGAMLLLRSLRAKQRT
jgi:hypothetical protein